MGHPRGLNIRGDVDAHGEAALRAALPNLECTATCPGHLVGGWAQDSAFVTNSPSDAGLWTIL